MKLTSFSQTTFRSPKRESVRTAPVKRLMASSTSATLPARPSTTSFDKSSAKPSVCAANQALPFSDTR